MKTCKKCNTEKNESDFYNTDNSCKECRKKLVKQNRLKNIEYYLQYDRERANRPDRVEARKKYAKTPAGIEAHKRGVKKWQSSNLIKRAANHIVNNALRDKKIVKPKICSECNAGNTTIHGHHDDYAFPLSVRWLCSKCHNKWHKENGQGLNGN